MGYKICDVPAPKKKIYLFRAPDTYGYITDLNHPRVRQEYEARKKLLGLSSGEPMSDEQRWEFDRYMSQKYKTSFTAYQMRIYDEGGAWHEQRDTVISELYGLEKGTADSA